MYFHSLRKTGLNRSIAVATLIAFLLCSNGAALAQAIPKATRGGANVSAPPVDVLPQVRSLMRGVGSLEKLKGANILATQPASNPDVSGFNSTQGADRLVIHQSEPKAVIDWESFNIGKDAWTHFDQQGNTDWMALNRIYDRNPSLIFGKLTADGRVFLINQNGILFGPDSQTNVYSLTASTLNIKNDDFLNGHLKFKAENYQSPADPINSNVYVTNEGTIETPSLGSIFLVGQNVENAGTISSPVGQIGLAAGEEVDIYPDTSLNTTRTARVVNVLTTSGEVTNLEGGRLSSDTGLVGMYGRVVNQNGLVRAVTAVKKAGKIELYASERISTGPNSVTDTPVSDSTEKVNESFSYQGGEIQLRGLDPDYPLNPQAPVGRIEHRGRIEAKSGSVTLEAKERVFLEDGSSIDVSGAWVNLPAEANLISVQLNSVNLRDDFGQKAGLLKGKTVLVNALYGSSIGDISGYLQSQEKTALERSVTGGDIIIAVRSGDIVLKQGASVDFSGGGFNYSAGKVETTKLISGGKVYDISLAPEYLDYSAQSNSLSYYNELYARNGLKAGIAGLANQLYFGLSTSSGAMSAYVEGADAGSLTLVSRQMVLDGQMDGSVTRGPYQNLEAELVSSTCYQMTRGRKAPLAGTLILGDPPTGQSPELRDLVLSGVTVQAVVGTLPADFGPADPLPSQASGSGVVPVTTLSVEQVDRWGLRQLTVNTNSIFSLEAGSNLSLAPGGILSVNARRIELRGEVEVRAGTISLQTLDNMTSLPTIQGITNPNYVSLTQGIFIEPGARLGVAGQRIDNSINGSTGSLVLKDGGSVLLFDNTGSGQGVFAESGASIDVSGGWSIDAIGKISGGNAGSLNVIGSSIELDSDISGYALSGQNGGKLSLQAQSIEIAASGARLSAGRGAGAVIVSGRFEQTGFTSFDLTAADDLVIDSGAGLAPSTRKFAPPSGALKSGSLASASSRLIVVPEDQIGASSVRLKAGQILPGAGGGTNVDAVIMMSPGSYVRTAPSGAISLDAAGISLAGRLDAPAGSIAIKSSQSDISVLNGARLSAAGTNVERLQPVLQGLPAGCNALSAGSVTLDSSRNISIEQGVLIDVSGSSPTSDYFLPSLSASRAAGVAGSASSNLVKLTVAGNPGSISLSALGSVVLAGEVSGRARLEGLQGGSLSIQLKSLSDPLVVRSEDVERYLASGFDALSFTSYNALDFRGSLDAWVPRRLTIDAPVVRGSGEDAIRIGSPWVTVVNSYFPSGDTPSAGNATLELYGGWLDANGSILLSGFADVHLRAQNDIRFSDVYYQLEGQPSRWEGRLSVPGELMLQASRAYPTTLSDFTVSAGGKLTTIAGDHDTSAAIYSAGGRLVLQGADIEHYGALYAPLGELRLEATRSGGRIYLAEGSVLASGGEAAVKYGDLSETFWTRTDKKTGLSVAVDSTPAKSVSLKGDEIIVREGALVDASGGGSVFSYQFLPGIDGSKDPLKVSGRYVIVPDGSVQLPGRAVVIAESSAGLAAGTYSLLPEEYAFLPGAVIIQATGSQVLPGALSPTKEGFPVAAGYFTEAGTGVRSTVFQGFSVRAAADVLKEGYFNQGQMAAGDGGQLSFSGKTTILEGSLRAQPLAGYLGGALELVGTAVNVLERSAFLPEGFGPESTVPAEVAGTLNIAYSSISGQGFQSIALGSSSTTQTVTIQNGIHLDVVGLTVAAGGEITIGSGVQITAVSSGQNGGSLSLYAPGGKVAVLEGAVLQADRSLSLNARDVDLKGDLSVAAAGAISLAGDSVFIVPDAYARTTQPGLYLEERIWSRFGSIAQVSLQSRSDLVFAGNAALSAGSTLSLDGARLAGDGNVTLAAGTVNLLNSGASAGTGAIAGSGRLIVNAGAVNLGRGDVRIEGFSSAKFNAGGDVTAVGKGSLSSSGDVTVRAARLILAPYTNGGTSYERADFRVEAPGKTFNLMSSGGSTGPAPTPGGILTVSAGTIDVGGTIETVAGQVGLGATGSGVYLRDGARISSIGNELAPGGAVTLTSTNGTVSLSQGAVIDVSAGSQGDAGSISIVTPGGSLSLLGSIRGASGGGKGGAFALDVQRLDDLSALNVAAAAGGFNETLDFRARTGDVVLAADQTLTAGTIRLTADAGNISLQGVLDASGPSGGRVELYSGSDLSLESGSQILARGVGAGAAGGAVTLSSSGGDIRFLNGALIDVSGDGSGGTVSLRAAQQGSDVRMALNGTIAGARAVYAEAFRVYTASTINSGSSSAWQTDAQTFMNNAVAVEGRLISGLQRQGWTADALHLLPGIEVRSPGDMTLASDWDLTSWRFAGEPGALTLRAGGNLNLNANLVDHPTSLNSLPGSTGRDSWAIKLVAGAEFTSSDPMVTSTGTGDLKLSDGKQVYSESAPIVFSSGRDTLLGPGAPSGYMINAGIRYSIGSYDGGVTGRVGRNLDIRGGAIQTATGDIAINVGNDLILEFAKDYGSSASFTSLGSVRTTGRPTSGSTNYWDYADGGSITLNVRGHVAGGVALNAWDGAYGFNQPRNWAASFDTSNATEGLATLGGGSLAVHSGGDFLSQAGTFGRGDLRIYAGGDVNGRFLVKEGDGKLISLATAGSTSNPLVLEMFDSEVTAAAVGDLTLGAVVNPTIARDKFTGIYWDLRYSQEAAVAFISKTGDVRLLGDSQYYNLGSSQSGLERIMPANLEVRAGRDILFSNDLALAPSATSNLVLSAGRDIDGQYQMTEGQTTILYRASVSMSDLDPAAVYGVVRNPPVSDFFAPYAHGNSSVHAGDAARISISAQRDIKNVQLYLPKQAEINAGRDIRDIFYVGQNVGAGDATIIKARRDIFFSTQPGTDFATGIEHGGPGILSVMAGNSIDLGTTRGITTFGNAYNPVLGSKGSDVFVVSGYEFGSNTSYSDLQGFFSELIAGGTTYSTLQKDGNTAGAKAEIDRIRADVIQPLLGDAVSGTGVINMTTSQISTSSGADSIFIVGGGALNVGRTTFVSEDLRQNTGIFTAAGGSIAIYSEGDINVNESRVMTFRGGDITLWSNAGSINAGRGSKTAISVDPPKVELIGEQYVLVFRPPAVGSGIRAVTYDPDGIEGPLVQPPPGDIYAFAPKGVIDAGEAGIAGGNITLGATAVLNAQNISFAFGSVGVPDAGGVSAGIGALAGAGSVSETTKIAQESASVKSAEERVAKFTEELNKNLVPKIIMVEVMGFEEEEKRN